MYHIAGKMEKSRSKTYAKVLGQPWLAILRSQVAVARRGWMAGNTHGWTHAASTNQAVQSFRRRSIRCSSGTRMLKSVMLICRTWRNDRSSLRVSGLLGVGHYKSCWLRSSSSSMTRTGGKLTQNFGCYGKFNLSLASRSSTWWISRTHPLPRSCPGRLEDALLASRIKLIA